ncbi:MAG: phytoene desaturase family protein [Haloarculaceae archaeon]
MSADTGARIPEESVVVVGGGIGGLSAACYLADAGADVTLLEKNDQLGGRASRLEREGFRFDMGPSWYLMPDVFERFFGHFGKAPEDYYGLERLDPHYRIFFKDGGIDTDGGGSPAASGESPGNPVDISPDRRKNRELFEAIEPGAGEAFDEYLATSERHYETAMEKFVYEDRSRLRDWVDLDVMLAAPVGLKLVRSMQRHVERYFDDPKLQQIMQYTLVFLGGSPKSTPALYNIMSHVDFNLGVYYPVATEGGVTPGEALAADAAPGGADPEDGAIAAAEGGIGIVIDAVVALARERGVTFETGTEVTEVTRRKDGFLVATADGTERHPDRVVVNADYAHAEQELLPGHERQYDAGYWDDRTYAPSAYLLYLGIEGDVPELAHHTLVLPDDWDPHFDRIFEDPAWPDDPAYYLCVPSKTDDSVAPDGHSNLFVLVPIAPGLDDDDAKRERFRDLVLDDVAANTGVDLRDRIVVEEEFCVSEFVERYNATRGTALGLAHTLRQTALLRPPNRSSAVDGLYFTGSFTTPGIGVPMCLISGEHTAQALIDDAS